MDPDATFKLLLEALAAGDVEDAELHAGNLADWVKVGGYKPSALAEVTS